MKIFKTTFKRTLGGICAVCALSVLLSSCLKNDTATPVGPPVALVNFTQASPDQPLADIYFDNNKIDVNAVSFGTNLTYFSAYAGTRTVTISSYPAAAKIFSDTVHLAANGGYSLFLANTPAHPEFVLLNDTLSRPASGTASVRFVNLSPDAPAVDFAITGGAVLSPDKGFKGYSAFLSTPANKNYDIEVRKAGTSTVLATLPNVNINEAFVYTIYLRGLAAGTTSTDKLSLATIINAFY